MTGYDAAEGLTPFRDERGYGAILFDNTRVRQAKPEWFSPAFWGELARPVASGGRGGAWFVDAPFGSSVLRSYLRGGLAAHFSRDRYWWRGANRTRSFLRVMLPMTMPGVAAGSVLVFIPTVGQFVVSDLLGGAKVDLLGNLLQRLFTRANPPNWPLGSAMAIIFMLVLTVVVVFYFRTTTEEDR